MRLWPQVGAQLSRELGFLGLWGLFGRAARVGLLEEWPVFVCVCVCVCVCVVRRPQFASGAMQAARKQVVCLAERAFGWPRMTDSGANRAASLAGRAHIESGGEFSPEAAAAASVWGRASGNTSSPLGWFN